MVIITLKLAFESTLSF